MDDQVKNDLMTVGKSLEFLATNAMWQKGALVEVANFAVERETRDCPCKGMTPEVCKQFEGGFDGVCKAFDPDYEFMCDRMMTKGYSTCHWVVRRKSVDTGSRQQEPMGNDSLGY